MDQRFNIKETIAIVNEMQAEGVIGRYAIGGAVGATWLAHGTSLNDNF